MSSWQRGLRQRYQRAFVPKPREVEELVDYYWHRPLAAWLTVVLERTPISPLQVTLASLATGVGSAVLVACAARYPEPGWFAGAACLLFLSVLCDCADGQLARMRGEATEFGRIVDGLVDNVVVAALYLALILTVTVRAGVGWGVVTALAGITMPLRLVAYDRLRYLHLRTQNSEDRAASGTDSLDCVAARVAEAQRIGDVRATILLRLYQGYCQAQCRLIPEPSGSGSSPCPHARPGPGSMRVASYLGLGTHMAILYLTLLLAGFTFSVVLLQQLIFLLLLNSILIHVLRQSWRHA